jgi:hypothetical protein
MEASVRTRKLETFNAHVKVLARKSGFDFEALPNGTVHLSRRSSAGDDEPRPSDVRAAQILAANIADAYPSIRQLKAVTMELVDEWVELTVSPTACLDAGLSLDQPVKLGLSR